MAEIFTNVHDILFPSPPALKDIAAISITVQLWRQEINTHRIKNTLTRLNLEQNILSSETLPRIPVTIVSLIKLYVRRIGLSIQQWLDDHGTHFLFKREILNDFIDFVGDFDGTIDYVKTARRLVLCDRIDKITRFNVACFYCFEDVISHFLPAVSSEINSNGNWYSLTRNPVQFYWICKLKNQLYKLPRSNSRLGPIENRIFATSFPAWTTKEYFWNRLDVNSRLQQIQKPPLNFAKIFSRYLVAKFNEVELDKFSNGSAYCFMSSLLKRNTDKFTFMHAVLSINKSEDDFQSRARYFKALWAYIKHRMNASSIYRLMRRIARILYASQETVNTSSVYCEWWNTIPDHVKPRLTEGVSKDDNLLQREQQNVDALNVRSSCLFDFLFAILSDSSDEEKNKFWSKNWRKLIDVMCTAQLNQLMKLCFDDDENKIAEFKTTCLMSAIENIKAKCSKLLYNLRFKELNEFLSFCYLDEQARKTIRTNLLVDEFRLDRYNISKLSPQLKDFINDAYDDVNLATDFKTRLLFSPSTQEIFNQFTEASSYVNFHLIISAVDIIAPSEQIARDFKKLHIFPIFEQKVRAGSLLVFAEGEFLIFLRDCLGSDDEMARFKETLTIDELVQNMIRTATTTMNAFTGSRYNSFLVQLLEWYFESSQALEEFKSMYADDCEFVQLTSK